MQVGPAALWALPLALPFQCFSEVLEQQLGCFRMTPSLSGASRCLTPGLGYCLYLTESELNKVVEAAGVESLSRVENRQLIESTCGHVWRFE